MIKLYLKQAWTLIKQNKLFTSIYVVGTGLSIALTMTMFIIFYVKFAPIYPEYNRDRMLTIKAMKCYPKTNKESWNCNGGASYYLVDKMLKDLPHLEAIGAGKQDLIIISRGITVSAITEETTEMIGRSVFTEVTSTGRI